MADKDYIQCTTCVMDTSDSSIIFDEQGVCNYCRDFDKHLNDNVFQGEKGQNKLTSMIHLIKKAGKNKTYDCILGVSGGVDSTYLAYKVKEWGLRPLAVHFDNGWNSELAVVNIARTLRKMKIDMSTYVVDWEEFRDLQLSYFKASVLDIEIPTDHGFIGSLNKIAAENKVKYIITGHNYVTESILPPVWYYNKGDATNILAIQKEFGSIPLKTYPYYTVLDKFYYNNILKQRFLYPLNFIQYNKKEVKELIKEKLGWRDYGGKHYESIFTRFYQGYILPTKFNIDKRKAHLSNLICSKQLTKQEAQVELDTPMYDPEQFIIDKQYVLKKLGLTDQEFEGIMKLPIRQHTEFATNKRAYSIYMNMLRALSPLSKLLKKLS